MVDAASWGPTWHLWVSVSLPGNDRVLDGLAGPFQYENQTPTKPRFLLASSGPMCPGPQRLSQNRRISLVHHHWAADPVLSYSVDPAAMWVVGADLTSASYCWCNESPQTMANAIECHYLTVGKVGRPAQISVG